MTLTSVRNDIKTALQGAGLKALEYVAETITPPVTVVVPADPYVSEPDGQTPFGHYDVNLHILLVVGKGTNQTNANNLDSMIEQVIAALDEWDITEVTQPGQVNLNNSVYLGAVVSIQQTVKLGV